MKKLVMVTALITIVSVISWSTGGKESQEGPTITLVAHTGSDKNDIGKDLLVHDNAVFVTGVTIGELPGNKTSGAWDMFLARYGKDGTCCWIKQWGKSGRDVGTGIAADTTGLYVTGYTEENQNFDIFLIKFSFKGEILWTRQWGTDKDDKGLAVTVCSEGIYVTGLTEGGLDGNRNAGKSDLFLTLLTPDGEKIRTIQTGSPKSEWGKDITSDDTGVYVTGFTMGALEGNKAFGFDDIFLSKFSFNCEMQWLRQWGTSGNDEGKAVAADSGSIYVAGRVNGDMDGEKRVKLDDAFISKFDQKGEKEWTVIIGTGGNDEATGIAVKGSNVYAAGSTGGQFRGNSKTGYYNVWLAKYTSEGNRKWIVQHGTGGFDFSGKLYSDPSGLYLTGDFSTSVDGRDIFLIRWEE